MSVEQTVILLHIDPADVEDKRGQWAKQRAGESSGAAAEQL